MAGGLLSILASSALVASGLGLAVRGAEVHVPTTDAVPRAFTVTAAFSSNSVLRDERTVLTGTVKPVRTATRVLIQRRTDDGWIKMAKRTMKDDGSFRFAFKVSSAGTYTYRARMPMVGEIQAANSPEQELTVAEEALVVFTIPQGTGSGDWNTPDSKVVMNVGDTLRLVNNDSMAHRLHTDGAPFPHAADNLAPGASVDFVTTDPLAGWLYCHIHGQTSQFWIDVLEP